MSYSKNKFIIPLSDTDSSVKIRNNAGVITYTLNDEYSVANVVDNCIIIKQKSDTRNIKLDFPNNTEATEAIVLLNNAINVLKINLKNKEAVSSIIYPKPYRYPIHNTVLSDIWGQSDLLPDTAPNTTTLLIEVVEDLQLTHITNSYAFSALTFIDIINPNFGDGVSYNITLKTYNDIDIPIGWKEWYVDLDRNLLIFPEGFSSNGPILVDESHPPKISFYKYIGVKGIVSGERDLYLSITVQNDNDTTFVLDITPSNVVSLTINGLIVDSIYYEVIDNVIEWIGPYNLETSDEIILQYN